MLLKRIDVKNRQVVIKSGIIAMWLLGLILSLTLSALYPACSAAAEKVLIFAGDRSYPPLESLKDGKAVGLNVDLLKALAQAMDKNVEIRLMKWADAQQMLLSEEADALTAMSYSEERAALYDFSEPMLEFEFSFFVKREDVMISTVKDVEGKIVAVTKGGYPKNILASNKKIALRIVENYSEGFRLLLAGEVAAVAADLWVGAYTLQKEKLGDNIKIVEQPFTKALSSVAVKKGNTALLDEINQGVRKLRREGTIQRIIDSWSGKKIVFFTEERVGQLRLLGIIALLVICFTVLWVFLLRRQVGIRTTELRQAQENLELKVQERTTELMQTTRQLRQELSVNKALAEVADTLLVPSFSIRETAELVLRAARELTGSRHALVGSVDPSSRNLVGHTTAMMGEDCTMQDRTIVLPISEDGRYRGLWGHALNTRQGFYTNDPDSHEQSIGIPSGHVVLENYLNVPAVIENVPVGQIALANKQGGYTDQDLTVIERLAALFALSVQRKQMEESLSESEEKFRGIFNDALYMIHIIDARGRIVAANPIELEVMGYSREEYTGRSFFDALHPDDSKTSTAIFRQVLAGKTIRNYETSLMTKTGAKVAVEISSVPQFEDDKLVSVRSISRDITKRKKTEEELAGHRKFLESMVEKRTKELRSKMHELQRSEASAQKRAEELIGMRRAMLNMMEDLKDARARAEAGSQAKSIFLANMSHELRTPLNAILGFSQLMRTDSQATKKQLENLNIINRSGHHLLQLINDVLDMSKIEAGRMQLDLQDLDLGELVRDVIDMMRLRAEGKGLSLVLAQDSSFPRFIHGDGPKLRQILINLVGNAVKFTETGEITVHLYADNGEPDTFVLHGEVRDSGPGISPQDMERIFMPFQQTSVSDTQNGTGLGLTITKKFVQTMQGAVSVQSEPGRGSVFSFSVRVGQAETYTVAEAVVDKTRRIIGLAPNQQQRSILVVEDNFESRLLVKTLLTQTGFLVQEAENGEQAVAIFKKWQPDFIWLDMRMPVMDGYEAASQIRSLPGGKQVKIVALTASAFKEQYGKILAAGCDAVLHKPFRTGELFSVMKKYLSVHYVYKEECENVTGKSTSTVTVAMIAKLPDEQKQALRVAAQKLDIAATEETIKEIRNEHPEVAGRLQVLVHEFRFGELLELLT